jgi:hypothetical protein
VGFEGRARVAYLAVSDHHDDYRLVQLALPRLFDNQGLDDFAIEHLAQRRPVGDLHSVDNPHDFLWGLQVVEVFVVRVVEKAYGYPFGLQDGGEPGDALEGCFEGLEPVVGSH